MMLTLLYLLWRYAIVAVTQIFWTVHIREGQVDYPPPQQSGLSSVSISHDKKAMSDILKLLKQLKENEMKCDGHIQSSYLTSQ